MADAALQLFRRYEIHGGVAIELLAAPASRDLAGSGAVDERGHPHVVDSHRFGAAQKPRSPPSLRVVCKARNGRQ
jgi:hypothetical protein